MKIKSTTLKTRVIIFTTLVFSLLALSLYSLFNTLLMGGFLELERDAAYRNVQRAIEGLHSMENEIAIKAQEWGSWDDSYEYLKKPNHNYDRSNLSFSALDQLSIRHFLLIKSNGKIVKGLQVDSDNSKVTNINNDESTILTKIALLSVEKNKPLGGFIRLSGKTLLVGAAPVTDSAGNAPSIGAILFSRDFNSNSEERIQELVRISTVILPIKNAISDPDLQAAVTRTLEKGTSTTFVTSTTSYGVDVFPDTFGTPILIIYTKQERDLLAKAIQSRNIFTIYTLMFTLLAVIGALWFLNRTIIKPLFSIGKQSAEIGRQENAGQRVSIQGAEEFQYLGLEINRMLEQLELSKLEILKAKGIAERANAAKSMFIARVSHELRNPIHGIRGVNDLILKRESSKAVHDLVKMGDEAAEGLLSIVDEILDFSKAESGELAFEKIDYDIRQVARDALQIAAARLQGKYKNEKSIPVQLVTEIDPEVPQLLKGDPTRLRQVLVNLLTNSVKFTENGFVGLKISANIVQNSDAIVKFDIWDTGIGIPEDKVSSLFQPFKQVDESITRKYQGSGLGLSIVKQFTEGLGGNITVTSILGKGSTFSVSLPQIISEKNVSSLHIAAQNKRLPIKSILIASSSPVYTPLISTFEKLAIPLTIINCTDPEQIKLVEEKIGSADLVIFSEEAWKAPSIQYYINNRLPNNNQCYVALVRPANLELREKLYMLGILNILTLPVLADDILNAYIGKIANPIRQTDQTPPETKINKKLRVLIADDAPTNRLILQEMLEEEGHSVVQVGDGKEILNLITPMLNGESNAEHFDLIITDITMPLMNGDEATRVIRNLESKNSNGLHVPIVAITGHAFGNEQDLIRQAGVDGILTKPMRPENLLSELARLFYKSS